MSISSIVYGINNVSIISSSTPQFTADKARKGWNYQASGATDNIALKIFSEDGFTNTNNLFNVTVRGAVGNTTYANIPYLSIKTKPKGDGTDFDPSFHSQQIFKIDNNDFVSSDELVYFYYNNLVPQLDEFKKAEYKLTQTNGTLDPNNPILTVELISDNSSTTSFYLQNTEVISKNHQHKYNRIIEYRNQDTETNLEGVIDELELILDQVTVTASNTSSIDNNTSNIDNKITVGEDDTLTQAQQILIYGRKDSSPTGLSAVKVSNDGSLHVSTAKNAFNKTNEILALPSNGTANSTAVNTLAQDGFGISATSTNSTDPIELYTSNDNLTFYPTNITGGAGKFYHEIYHPNFNYYRISQTDTTTTSGTINVICSKR